MLVLGLVVLTLVAGCSKDSKKPDEPEVPVPPTPNTPLNALALVRYCWTQRDITTYEGVFSEDFLYEFSPTDGQGAATINRDEELAIARNLFAEGVTGHPAASSVLMTMEGSIVLPDDRPGKNATWHKRISTTLRLTVRSSAPVYSTAGPEIFYVTRGDSAQIPAEMAARGFGPDPNRWYVDHWSDVFLCPAGKVCVTVGKVKLDYAGGPVRPELAGP